MYIVCRLVLYLFSLLQVNDLTESFKKLWQQTEETGGKRMPWSTQAYSSLGKEDCHRRWLSTKITLISPVFYFLLVCSGIVTVDMSTPLLLLKDFIICLGNWGGENLLFEAAKRQIASLSRKQVATWLANQAVYSLQKVPGKLFKRNKVVWHHTMAGGLGGVKEISKHCMKDILAQMDILSKTDWAIGLEGKRDSEITSVFKAVCRRGCMPQKLQALKHFKTAF